MNDFWNQPIKTRGLALACQACGGNLPHDPALRIWRDHMPYCSLKCAESHPGPPAFAQGKRPAQMADLKQWRNEGRHLPEFMRDFHKQKNLFKTIHELYHSTPRKYSTPPPDWIQAHAYTIDSFLWFMAAHGWTLQRNHTKSVRFLSIDATLRAAQEKRDATDTEMLKARITQGKPADEVKP